MVEEPVVICIATIDAALASESFTMPKGLSREEKRQFIKDCANGKIKGDNHVRQTE